MSDSDPQEFIITIDGPAGAGKSSVARLLADYFGFDFLDTGAMYRALTLVCLQAKIDLSDPTQIVELANGTTIEFGDSHVFANGNDVTADIRSPEVNQNIRFIADNPQVRHMLAALQVQLAEGKRIVTEGRDQGTDVFPHAGCKIFLTATPETRAERRYRELIERGQDANYEQVLAAQEKRDLEDSQRPVGALRPAIDAEIVFTDDMSQDQVVEKLASIVRSKMAVYL